jgi:hypothetical protein
VAPLHPLRHDARAFSARAGAALAVFFAIAIVLLAGGADQPLASAEANKGDTGTGDAAATVPAPEPVLGEVPPAAPPVEDTPADPPVEDTPAAPAIPEPPSGAPSLTGDDTDEGVGDPGNPSGGGKDKDKGKDKG